tara:strand:- start:183 stop:434 length:252 start_codon:yes stop_codon:yes gene_type:complete
LRAWCEWLTEIIGIQIRGDDDIFRGWRGTEDFVEMTGEGASVGAAEEKLETELGVGFGEGRWDRVSQGNTVGEILGEFPMKSL